MNRGYGVESKGKTDGSSHIALRIRTRIANIKTADVCIKTSVSPPSHFKISHRRSLKVTCILHRAALSYFHTRPLAREIVDLI